MTGPVLAAPFIRWDWIGANTDDILQLTSEHLVLTFLPVAIGFCIALPLGVLSLRYPRLYGPLLGVSAVAFTIPSLALAVLLLPFTGLTTATAVIMLTIYTLLILLRNTVEGLRAVPRDVVEAAEAMGYRPSALLFKVQLPVALPVVLAGVRIATVTNIGLVAVTALIGQGGYGQFFIDGYQRRFATPQFVGIVLSVVLAVVADRLLFGVQRLLTPWQREAT